MAKTDAFLPESLPVFRDGVTLHAGLVSGRTFTAKFGLDLLFIIINLKFLMKHIMILYDKLFSLMIKEYFLLNESTKLPFKTMLQDIPIKIQVHPSVFFGGTSSFKGTNTFFHDFWMCSSKRF